MKINIPVISLFCITAIAASCNKKSNFSDASGVFETTETIISAETSGKIIELNIEEGDVLQKGQLIGYVDSTQLHLSKLQLMQNQKAILSGRPNQKLQLE